MRKLPRMRDLEPFSSCWIAPDRRRGHFSGHLRTRTRCSILKTAATSAGLLLALGAAGCNRSSATASGPPGGRPPTLVVAADVLSQDVPVYLDEIGTCTARESVNIEPQVSGRLTEIYFQDGADLKKGDKLFTIDPRPYEAALAGAQAQLEKDKALAANARANAVRQQQLFQKALVSPADYDQARYTADSQDAAVKIDAATCETARLNLEYCSIVSPIDGRAGLRLVDVGNVVQSDKNTAMLSIQRLDPIYVDFTATESDLPAIRRNMAAGTLKVFARIPNDGPATTVQPESTEDGRQGMLTFMDNAVANVTGTIKLRATMPNADHFFWPGQFVRVRLILKTIKDVPVIPADALQLSQQGTFVYVIGKDMTVQQRPVKVGQRQGAQGELLAIDSGVKAGEKVVVTGQLTLGPGAPVIISQGAGTQPVADAGGKP